MAKDKELANVSDKPEKAAKPKKKQPNKVIKYFKDLRSEFKKVVWPTKQQIINNTSVVLVTIVVSGLFIWGFDTGLTALLNLVLKAN